MTKQKKNIDELFKNRLQNEQAGFNPAHWDKMASLLDKQFLVPSASSGVVRGLSSLVKVLIVSVSISVPAVLYLFLGTNIFIKNDVSIEKPNLIYHQVSPMDTVSQIQTENNADKRSLIQNNDLLKVAEKVDIQKKATIINKIITKSDQKEVVSDIKSSNPVSEIVKNQDKINSFTENKFDNSDKTSRLTIGKSDNKQTYEKSDKNISADNNTEIKPLLVIDSIVTKDELNKTESESNLIRLKNYRGFYAIMGACYANSYSNDIYNNSAKEFSPIIGVGFEKRFKNKKYSLMFEVLYTRSKGHSLIKSQINTSYFLNKEINITTVKTQEIDLLRIPVLFKYSLKRHSFITGIFASYLLNTNSELTEIIQSTSLNSFKASNVKGYRDGLKDISYGFTLGYTYGFSNQFDMGISYQFSPDDLTKNAYYQNSIKDNLSEIQLNIRWKLY